MDELEAQEVNDKADFEIEKKTTNLVTKGFNPVTALKRGERVGQAGSD